MSTSKKNRIHYKFQIFNIQHNNMYMYQIVSDLANQKIAMSEIQHNYLFDSKQANYF